MLLIILIEYIYVKISFLSDLMKNIIDMLFNYFFIVGALHSPASLSHYFKPQ